jgi:hypothetical protein
MPSEALNPLTPLSPGGLARDGEPRLREAAFKTAITLRRMFQACGLRIKPLPFA